MVTALIVVSAAFAGACFLVLALVSWVLHLLARVEELEHRDAETQRYMTRQKALLPGLRKSASEAAALLDTRV